MAATMTVDQDAFPCPCCGYLTLGASGEYEICPICFSEDDPSQAEDPDRCGGANDPSLREAQANFAEFGACDIASAPRVRPPTEADVRAAGWAPLPQE